MNSYRSFKTRISVAHLCSALALLAAGPSFAQYKVIGPDGKVTYTDRAPTSSEGKVSPIGAKGSTAAAAPDAVLPAELKQAASRYPVTLYTITGACDVCGAARQFLRQRGIPYAEKQVLSPEDTEALARISGGRDVPTLTIGGQVMRGLSPDTWASYLDAAGYPRESHLPPSYQYAAPSPITDRAAAAVRTAEPGASAAAPAPATPAPANPSGIKF
jgi:glutaredoxin